MKPLLWIFQFAFGCRHRHLSRVFTIKRRTYRVCFDCGREFDLPDAHLPIPSEASPHARVRMNFL
jgi:hypothetical protein